MRAYVWIDRGGTEGGTEGMEIGPTPVHPGAGPETRKWEDTREDNGKRRGWVEAS